MLHRRRYAPAMGASFLRDGDESQIRNAWTGLALVTAPGLLLLLFLFVSLQTGWSRIAQTVKNDQECNRTHWHSHTLTHKQQQAIIKLIIRLIWIFLFFVFSLLRISKHVNSESGPGLWSKCKPYHAANKCFNAVLLASPERIRGAGVVLVT